MSGPGIKERICRWCRQRIISLTILGFVVLFLLVYLGPHMFFTIHSGHAGVVFRRFLGGTVTATVRDEGFQIIPPWDRLIVYDVRIQEAQRSFDVISSDGLNVTIACSIRFYPKIELLGLLHQRVGSNYIEKIVIPEVQAIVRTVFGQYTPEEMYTTKRSLIEQTLQGAIGNIQQNYVVLHDLLIKAIELPPAVRSAIEAKLVEQQRSLEMKFRIERAEQEAERHVIEAVGEREALEIVKSSLSDPVLQYRAIEATLKLAESTNSKMIFLGGRNGMPVLFNAGFNESTPGWPGAANPAAGGPFGTPSPPTTGSASNAPHAHLTAPPGSNAAPVRVPGPTPKPHP